MRKLSAKYAREPLTMSAELFQAYMEHDWPGNLRELENSVKRFLVLGDEQHTLTELRNARATRSVAAPQTSMNVDAAGGLKKLARSAMNVAETAVMGKESNANTWN